jgi:transposase
MADEGRKERSGDSFKDPEKYIARQARFRKSQKRLGKIRVCRNDRAGGTQGKRAAPGKALSYHPRVLRSKPWTHDGRALRRYRRRWIIERAFAWLGNSRRLVVRYDRSITIYEAFFHIACFMIVLRRVLK